MASLILFSFVLIFVHSTCWWFVSLLKKRNDVADIGWGIGFIVLTFGLFFYQGSISSFKTLVLLSMVTLWGLRLALHISLRHKGKPEDGRYTEMKKNWRRKELISYLYVFLLQGFFLILVATPIILYFSDKSPVLHWYNVIGLLIWLIGFLFEAVSDYQLAQFIKNPNNKGKIMKYGLWRYSRHPNYFGEVSLWWGLYLFTFFTPFWYLGIIGPITITILILGISGIPKLESRYIGNKEYEEYKKTTSAFFPMLPIKG